MGNFIKCTCHHCKKDFEKQVSDYNVSIRLGINIYCSRECSGLGRRHNKTKDQKKEEKRLYDHEYRAKNLETIKARKKEYFKRTYDPVQAAIDRKPRIKAHIERLRNPKYRAYKKLYDKKYLAKKNFGDFWESALLVEEIVNEYDNREVKLSNNLIGKTTKRKRLWQMKWKNNPNLRQLI